MPRHQGPLMDHMDREIGRIVAQLRSMDAFENTLIIFASDNGVSAEMLVRGDGHRQDAPPGSAESFLCIGPGWSSMCNTPFRRHKTWVHEGGISTPLIAHWPQGIKARSELRQNPGHFVDLLPTILELAGGHAPNTHAGVAVPPPPGKSLVPVFAADHSVSHDEMWWYHEGNRAIRVGDWKLVSGSRGQEWELYDLSHDRGESNNLAMSLPDKVRDLAARWQHQLEECRKLSATP